MTWQIAWASCDDLQRRTPGWSRIAAHQPKVFISQGDTPYTNGATSVTLYGYAAAAAFSATTTQAQALDKYRQFWAKPTAASLLALRSSGMLAYYQPDDHEWADDNWDHSSDSLGASFTTQALINTHWKRCNDAGIEFLAETWDNPVPDAAGNTQRPSNCTAEAQNPPTTDYPIRYFYKDFDEGGVVTSGRPHCRIIFIDCITYRSPQAAVDDASKKMLGDQQEAWLEAVLDDSRMIPFVLISSTKKLYRGSTDNSDTFGNYTTERDRLLTMINATGVKPIWLSGDRHILHITNHRVADGGLADIIDITACPIGVDVNTVGNDVEGLVWKYGRHGYGLITVGDTLLIELRDAVTGSVIWHATFNPFSNEPVYDTPVVVTRVG